MKRREFIKLAGLSALGLGLSSPKTARILFAGDTLLGGYHNGIYGTQDELVKILKKMEHPEEIFGELRNYFKKADLVWVNLEGPIVPESENLEKMLKKSFPLKQWERAGEILRKSGIHLVSLANNHIYDFAGEEGLKSTLELLETSFVGVGRGEEAYQGLIYNFNGMQLYLIALTDILDPYNMLATRDKLGVAGIPEKSSYHKSRTLALVKRNLKEAKADFKIAFLHWGPSSGSQIELRQKQIARILLEAGVDIIVGCHSHCKQPIIHYPKQGKIKKLVAYGMGNLVFGGKQGRQALSCAIEVELYKTSQERWLKYQVIDFIPNARGDFKPELIVK